LRTSCCCPSRGETAARPSVACRHALGASANCQKARENNSRVTLDISQRSIGKSPASVWKNPGPPLENFQTGFGKIPKSIWKNAGFQTYSDVLGRGPIPPQKTDFGKIPDSFWKNSGVFLGEIWKRPNLRAARGARPADPRTAPRASGRSARLTLRPCTAFEGVAWNGAPRHLRHADFQGAKQTAARDLRRRCDARDTHDAHHAKNLRDGIHSGIGIWSPRGPAGKPGNPEKHQYQYFLLL